MDNNNQVDITSARTFVERVLGFINKLWSVRFIRFLIVGGINSLFGYTIFSVFIFILGQNHYAIALLVATILGVLFNFFTTGRIVFKNRDQKLLFKFFGVYGITYLVNLLFLKIFDSYHVNILIAAAILILPVAILSYFLNRALVFRGKTT